MVGEGAELGMIGVSDGALFQRFGDNPVHPAAVGAELHLVPDLTQQRVREAVTTSLLVFLF